MLSTDPVDWKVDLATSDLVMPPVWVFGAEGVAQRIHIALRTIRGELFTDRSKGMPWIEGEGVDPNVVILGNPFDEVLAKSEARKIISAIDGVGSIDRLEASFDSSTRRMRIEFEVTCAFDDTTTNPPTVSGAVEKDL